MDATIFFPCTYVLLPVHRLPVPGMNLLINDRRHNIWLLYLRAEPSSFTMCSSTTARGSSLVCVFIMLMVRKYPILMEGAMGATGPWASAYFFSFYIVAVLVLINVLVAFILEVWCCYFECDSSVGAGGEAGMQAPPALVLVLV